MTILTHFLPESGPWSPFGFGWGYSPPRPNWTYGTEWANCGRSNTGGIEIPIHVERSNGCWEPMQVEFSSDSDSDDEDLYFNMNNNSGRVRRRRGRTPTSTKRLISPSDFLVEIDQNSEGSSIKDSQKENKSSKSTESNETGHLRRSKRNGAKENVISLCDSDEEDDINETSNYSVYQYLKTLLLSTGRRIDAIRGDGNCFFRALSKVIFGSQSYYRQVRKDIVDLMEKYPKKFEAFADGPMSVHISDMKLDKTWATQTEIYAAATLLNRDIYILSPDQSGEKYRWLLFSPLFKYSSDLPSCPCYITLCHTHGNHYDRVAAVSGKCNCDLEPPEMSGITETLDLTDENEIF